MNLSKKHTIYLDDGWIHLDNEKDYLKIEFKNGEYLFLEFNPEKMEAFNYLELKPADRNLLILTRDVLEKIEDLSDLIVEKMRKDGHDNESFLNYVRETVDGVLLGIITEETLDEM